MDSLFILVTAVATSISAYILWANSATVVNVNIRQRDSGDYSLGLYLEQHSGRPANNIVVRMWVNGKALPPFKHPSMKTGQSIEIGSMLPAGSLRWHDTVTDEVVALRTLRVEAEFGWWWRWNGYPGRGKVLFDMRDGDAFHRALQLQMWNPESARDIAIREACVEHKRWAQHQNVREASRLNKKHRREGAKTQL